MALAVVAVAPLPKSQKKVVGFPVEVLVKVSTSGGQLKYELAVKEACTCALSCCPTAKTITVKNNNLALTPLVLFN